MKEATYSFSAKEGEIEEGDIKWERTRELDKERYLDWEMVWYINR